MSGVAVGIRPGLGKKKGSILTVLARRMSDFYGKCFLIRTVENAGRAEQEGRQVSVHNR